MTPASSAAIRDGLLVAGADVLWIRDALRELERRARLNGGSAPARLRALLEMVDAVAGPTIVTLSSVVLPPAAVAAGATDDVIGTERAAELLECTDRWVRRRCKDGAFESAVRRSGRWTLSQAEVLALVEHRELAM